MKRRWLIGGLATVVLIVGMLLMNRCDTFTYDDVYVDRIVYRKSDSTPFTGVLEFDNGGAYGFVRLSNGLPFGAYEERQIGGDLIFYGEYLAPVEHLSKATLDLLHPDTILLMHSIEEGVGGSADDIYTLGVFILKSDEMFKQDIQSHRNVVDSIASAVFRDTRDLRYEGISVRYVSSVDDWQLHPYIGLHYRVAGDHLEYQDHDSNTEVHDTHR